MGVVAPKACAGTTDCMQSADYPSLQPRNREIIHGPVACGRSLSGLRRARVASARRLRPLEQRRSPRAPWPSFTAPATAPLASLSPSPTFGGNSCRAGREWPPLPLRASSRKWGAAKGSPRQQAQRGGGMEPHGFRGRRPSERATSLGSQLSKQAARVGPGPERRPFTPSRRQRRLITCNYCSIHGRHLSRNTMVASFP